MERIVREKSFPIKPFKHIRIGDPYYFDRMELKKEKSNRYSKLVCDTKITCCKVGAVIIREIEIEMEEFPDITVKSIDTGIYLAKDNEQLEVYKDGKWYGETTLKRGYDLGCDTARFEIEVDDRYKEIHTGADGYFGFVKELKQYFGFIAGLSFDGSLFSFEDVEQVMRYLFEFAE